MATRFYLPASGTIPVTPPALPTGWVTGSPPGIQCPTGTTKTDTALADFLVSESTASVTNIPVGIFISAPLAAQSIAGDVTAVVRGVEGASSSDDSLQVGLYLISNDGTSVLSTLYGGHAEALNTTSGALGQEIASAAQATRIIPATALTGQTAVSGDRLMILVGYRTHDISATARTSTLRLGDPSATGDFALTSGLTTDLDPWVELSATLAFAGGAAPIVVAVAQAVETSTAGTITPRHVVAVVQAVEVDTAGAVTPRHIVPVAQSVEADSAGLVSPRRLVAVAQAVETDSALPITVVGGTVPTGAGPRIVTSSPVGRIVSASPVGRITTTSARGRP